MIQVTDRIDLGNTEYINLDARYTDPNGNPFTSVSAAQTYHAGKMNELFIGFTVLVKESVWTEAKEYWVQPYDNNGVTAYHLVEKGAGTTDYADLDNKPTISDGGQGSPQIPLTGNVKVTATAATSGQTTGVSVTAGQNGGINMAFSLEKGADGQNGATPTINQTTKHWEINGSDTGVVAEGKDGAPGHNPNLGTFLDTDTKPTTGQAGDYFIVIDTTVTPRTASVWAWNGTVFADTGKSVEDFGLQFASGQAVNAVSVKDLDGNDDTVTQGVLSAEAGKSLNMQINGGEVIAETVDGTGVWTDNSGIVNYVTANDWYYWQVNPSPLPRNTKILDLQEYKQAGFNKIEIKANQEKNTAYTLFNDSFTPNTQNDITPSVLLTMLSGQMGGVGLKFITANTSLIINIDADVRYIAFRNEFTTTGPVTSNYAPSVVSIVKRTEVPGIVYDGLDSDATDKALSAKQGKLLHESMQGLTNDINEINTELDGADTESTTKYVFSDFNRTTNNVCVVSNGNVTTSSNYKGIKINLPENVTKIVAKTARGDGYYYGVSLFSSTSIAQANFLEGYRPSVEGGLVELTNIRADAKAVLVSCKNSQTDSYVDIITSLHTDGVKDNINSLNADVQEMQEQLVGIGNGSLYDGVVYPKATAASLADGDLLYVSGYPIGSKSRGETIVFRANITTFSKLSIGKSSISGAFGSNYSSWIEIDDTNVVIKKNANVTAKTVPHGLTIQNTIYVIITTNDDGETKITIGTVGGSATEIQKTITVGLYGGDGGTTAWQSNNYGYVKVLSTGSTLTDCELSVSNKHLRDPFWVFGASFDTTDDQTCWPYYAKQLGVDTMYINANPGRGSAVAYADLQRALALGTPKFLLWTMWGNDTASDLNTYIGNVKSLCDEKGKGIVLIIVDRPNSPASSSQYAERKQVIDSYINAGVRYWNIAAAVSSNPSDANGWYSGYLNTDDNQHPTALGSRAMALQLVVDVPELLQF